MTPNRLHRLRNNRALLTMPDTIPMGEMMKGIAWPNRWEALERYNRAITENQK